MGSFFLSVLDASGRQVQRRTEPNILHYQGAAEIMTRVFGSSSLSFELGVLGRNLIDRSSRPNPGDVGMIYAPNLTWLSLRTRYCNEGGLPDNVDNTGAVGIHGREYLRTLFGYQRQPVTFTATAEAGGCRVQSSYATFEFNTEADWVQHWPLDEEETEPPAPWINRQFYEGEHKYPWYLPSMKSGCWGDESAARGDPALAMLRTNLHRLGAFPVGMVVVKKTGADVLIASALMRRPMLIRPGGSLRVRYVGRIRP